MKFLSPVFAVVLTLAACAAPPPPPPPAPRPAPVPPPVLNTPPVQAQRPAGEWIDWPIAPGDWVYRRDDRGSIALFGAAGQNATITLRCDMQRRRVYLARESSTAAGRMVVRTSSALKEFDARSTGGSPAYVAVEILPADAILDAMALSRGRIAIELEGTQPVAIPSWAEITRITEDCRS